MHARPIDAGIGNVEQYVAARYRGADIQLRRAGLYLSIHRRTQRDYAGINHRLNA